MRKTIFFIAFLFLSMPLVWADDIPGPVVEYKKSFATASGIYAQIQGFYGWPLRIEDKPVKGDALHHCDNSGSSCPMAGYDSATKTYKSSLFAGRLSFGYDIGRFISIEMGGFINPTQTMTLTDLVAHHPKGTLKAAPPASPTKDKDIDVVTSLGMDALAKIRVPLANNFYVFAGGGAAWTYYRYTNRDNDPQNPYLQDHDNAADRHWNSLAPEAVAGMGYGLSEHIAVVTQFTHVFGPYKLTQLLADVVADKNGSQQKVKGAMPQNLLSMSLVYKF